MARTWAICSLRTPSLAAETPFREPIPSRHLLKKLVENHKLLLYQVGTVTLVPRVELEAKLEPVWEGIVRGQQ